MTLVLPDARIANGLGVHERFVRSTLWLACFLLTSLTTAPFPNLGDPRLLDPIGDGNRLGQILVIVLTLALGAFVLTRARWVVLRALTPALVLTLLVVRGDGRRLGIFRPRRCGGSFSPGLP